MGQSWSYTPYSGSCSCLSLDKRNYGASRCSHSKEAAHANCSWCGWVFWWGNGLRKMSFVRCYHSSTLNSLNVSSVINFAILVCGKNIFQLHKINKNGCTWTPTGSSDQLLGIIPWVMTTPPWRADHKAARKSMQQSILWEFWNTSWREGIVTFDPHVVCHQQLYQNIKYLLGRRIYRGTSSVLATSR